MKLFKRIASVLLSLAIIALPFIVWQQRQDIQDWYRLRGYTPPSNVVALADATTMNDSTRKLFYINHPQISGKSDFNAVCSQEASIVLGCYIPNKGIYLYNVTDARLKGVMEVTAAHEMLHAAYERLSPSERAHIDALTADEYKKVSNKRLLDTVEKYRSQDPTVVPNELHSILGTEQRSLSPELEAYYKRYFTNRATVVSFSEQYEGEFTSRQAQVESYDKQLTALKQQIDANKDKLSANYNALNAEKTRLDDLRANGDIAGYNSGVSNFNSQVATYNTLVKQVDQLIATYHSTVNTRNNIALEEQGLVQAIDSRPQSF